MREIELKFLVDEDVALRLANRLKSIGSGRQREKKLRTIYYDSQDHALRQAGIAFRLRHDGEHWVQTVKAGKGPVNGLAQSLEFEETIEEQAPKIDAIDDPEMRRRLGELLKGHPLNPVCESVIDRVACDIDLGRGAWAELAIDSGKILANGHSAGIHEVELELIEGKVGELFELAKRIFPRGGFRFSHASKGARGYMLSREGRTEAPLKPRKAEQVRLAPNQELESAAEAILRECLDQIAANADFCRKSIDPEGPHQLRIGLRRLRSALSVLKPAIGCAELDRLADDARWLGRVTGQLRDLDVIANDIIAPDLEQETGSTDLKLVMDSAVAAANRARAEFRTCLMSGRTTAFILDCARFIETRGWLADPHSARIAMLKSPVGELAASALQRRWKKVRKRAEGIAGLDIGERHELRKELKKMRYAAEFFSSLYGSSAVAPFQARMKKLQKLFGDLNDVASLEGHAALLESQAVNATGTARGLGYLVGYHRAIAEGKWAGAKSAWNDLKKSDLFWK